MEHYRENKKGNGLAEGLNHGESSKSSTEMLAELVDELMKESPNQEVVETYMSQVGLSYSGDSIEQLNQVLNALKDGGVGHESSP